MSVNHVLMVRPDFFAPNPETAATNVFQGQGVDECTELAQAEFDAAVASLRAEGVEVTVLPGLPGAPDAVFPNNWISFHDTCVVIYPMLSKARRLERRVAALASLIGERRVIDLTAFETRGEALEGTGSLVLDRRNKLAYACLGPRTHVDPLAEWSRQTGYRVIEFEAEYRGKPVYHTNVILAVGRHEAIVWSGCADHVRAGLASTGHRIIEIDDEEMENFAGNALELGDDNPQWWMSQRALASLRPETRAQFQQPVRGVAIPTIESVGGGSLRCMMCEVV